MGKKDAAVIKAMAELGLDDQQLTDEQEDQLARALDPELQFMQDVEELFTKNDPVD